MRTQRGVVMGLLAALAVRAPATYAAARGSDESATATNAPAARGAAAKAGIESALGAPVAATNAPVDATADELDVDRAKGILEGKGHVVIRRGGEILRADHVRYDMNSGEAHATGNVVITRPGAEWTGKTVTYNFKTGEGESDKITIDALPFRLVDSKGATRTKDKLYHLKGGRITTCSNDYPKCHYHLRARELEIEPGDHFTAHGATWFCGPVPIMYLPYWYHDMDSAFVYTPIPGYDSRMGAFLLNSFSYSLTPSLRAKTRLDYRTERGVGVGQDLVWKPDGGPGDLSLYYADDQNPVDPDDASTANIDSQRYRIRFRQDSRLSARDNVLMRSEYVSDIDLRRDFFEREYRQESEPDNHIAYMHRGDGYTVGLIVRKRLNDFYQVVERLPEVSLNVMRQEVGDSSVFYEGRNSAGYLQKLYAQPNENSEDYSAFRFDTRHMLYRPTRYWGFLNVTPRAGFRGTYYSKSVDIQSGGTLALQTNLVTRPDGRQDVVVQTVTGTNTVTSEANAVFRTRLETGVETSFKAYKMWKNLNGEFRHVLEPYGNYTLTTDPNVAPEELYQFDEIDQLDKEHWVRLGVRNKIQQKRGGNPFNLVDADVYTVWKISRQNDEKAIENLFFDVRTVPADKFELRFDGWWNFEEARFDRFNTRAGYTGLNWMHAKVEYRRIATQSDLLETSLDLLPHWRWSYNVYARYEFEDSRFEEEGIWVQRNFDCLSLRLGCNFMPAYIRDDGSERKEEFRFILAFWLTAFPDMNLGTGTRHMK